MVIVFLINGCGCDGELPIEKIKRDLKSETDYQIVLDDMMEEGNFVKQYYHKYKVVKGENSHTTDWLQVPKSFYQKNSNYLGMAIVSKKDGKEIATAAPPGYQYVGDSRYGQWRTDHRGSSFWEFYGKYALFSTLLGTFNRPIYRNDYNDYQRYRDRRQPYYGNNNRYGTDGSYTQKSKPNFFERRKARERMKTSSFNDKVSRRIGRSRTGYRSRSGGFGK